MKKIICLATALILLFSMYISVGAEESECWYIRRGKSGEAPTFPPTADYISDNNGYYLDNSDNAREKKLLYLTFDAGYENGNIERILDIMKEKGVTSAFFILSNLIDKNPELVNRMANEGHLICNHTKNHKDLTKLTDAEVEANLKSLEDSYRTATGREMSKFFRFPEGRFSREKVALCNSLGYKCVFWSIAYADWDNAHQPDTEAAFNKLMSQTHPGAIILLHPTSATNAAILGRLIDAWHEMGYTFASLNEL